MAEWSKAIDLSSIIFGCAGSNPAGTIFKKPYSNKSHELLIPGSQVQVLLGRLLPIAQLVEHVANKGFCTHIKYPAPVAKWIRRPPSKRKIVGSIPIGGILRRHAANFLYLPNW